MARHELLKVAAAGGALVLSVSVGAALGAGALALWTWAGVAKQSKKAAEVVSWIDNWHGTELELEQFLSLVLYGDIGLSAPSTGSDMTVVPPSTWKDMNDDEHS